MLPRSHKNQFFTFSAHPARLIFAAGPNTPTGPEKEKQQAEAQKPREYLVPSLISDKVSEEVRKQVNKTDLVIRLLGQDGITDPNKLDKDKIIEKLESLKSERGANHQKLLQVDKSIRDFLENLLNLQDDAGPAFERADVLAMAGATDQQLFRQTLADIAKKDPCPLTKRELRNLNVANEANLKDMVTKLHTDSKLTDDERDELLEHGPKQPAEVKRIKDAFLGKLAAYDTKHNTNHQAQLAKLLSQQEATERQMKSSDQDFNNMIRTLSEHTRQAEKDANVKMARYQQIKKLRQEIGLPLKEGMILEGSGWSFDPENPEAGRNAKNRIKIESISFDPIKWTELDEEFDTNAPSQPVIEYSWELEGTDQKGTSKRLAGDFARFVKSNNVNQRFENLQELASELDLELQPGAIINFQARDAEGKQKGHQAKILSVANDKIVLDQEVTLDAADRAAGLEGDFKKKEFTLGEFARWYRKTEALPELTSLKNLNAELKKHNEMLNEAWGRDPKLYPPIQLKSGKQQQYLSYEDTENPIFTVTDANNKQITFEGNDPMTPSEFLRWVKQNDVENASPEAIAERQANAKNLDAAEKKAFIDQKLPELKDHLQNQQQNVAEGKEKAPSTQLLAGPRKWIHDAFIKDVQVLNMMEIYEIFKHMYEYAKENREQNSKRRVGTVEEKMFHNVPYFSGLSDKGREARIGVNSEKVKNQAENYKNTMTPSEQMEELYNCNNLIALKALLTNLSELGMLRFEEDKKLHAKLVELLPPQNYPEKFAELQGKPVELDKETKGVFVQDKLRILIDGEWGEGTYDNFYSTNLSKYNERKQKFSENFHNYEFLQGGAQEVLKKMLEDHMNGVEVDPAKFDGLLEFGMKSLEWPPDQSLMFFILAFGAKNKHGKTLLAHSKFYPYVRANSDNVTFMFFAVGHKNVDENGNPIMDPAEGKQKEGKLQTADFAHWVNTYVKRDIELNKAKGLTGPKIYTSGPNMLRFMHEKFPENKKVKQKASEKATNANQHTNLFHTVGPIITEPNDLDYQMRASFNARQSIPTLKNMYAGYNNQLKVRCERIFSQDDPPTRIEELANMLSGFVYFDTTLRGRRDSSTGYIELTENALDSPSLADKENSTRQARDNTTDFALRFLTELANSTNDSELKTIVSSLKGGKKFSDAELRAIYNQVNKSIRTAGKQNKQALFSAANNSKMLHGMSGSQMSKEEAEQSGQAQPT